MANSLYVLRQGGTRLENGKITEIGIPRTITRGALAVWLAANAVGCAPFSMAYNGQWELDPSNAAAISVRVEYDGKWYDEDDKEVTEPVITISAQPEDASADEGNIVIVLGVTASKDSTDAIVYQWQQSSDGVNWTDISGATTASYTIPTDLVAGEYHYRAVLTCGSTQNESDAATITVVGPVITISAQPASVGVTAGAISGNLAITAATDSSVLPLTYQWQAETDGVWTDIEDENAASMAIPTALTAGTYDYRVICASGSTQAISNTATVTVTGGE